MLPPKKRRKVVSAIEEISFDPNAREDYLSGFHKRKLQRVKHAKEEAAKREGEEKLSARKLVVKLRESRKADLEKHVEAVNTFLRDQEEVHSESSYDEHSIEEERQDGVAEDPAVDHEDEYIDEDRFTTVKVEAVDVSKDGLHRINGEDINIGESGSGSDESSRKVSVETAPNAHTESGSSKRVWTKEKPKGLKKKRKKFRYESKAERKVTRYKEKSGNKAKAKARKNR